MHQWWLVSIGLTKMERKWPVSCGFYTKILLHHDKYVVAQKFTIQMKLTDYTGSPSFSVVTEKLVKHWEKQWKKWSKRSEFTKNSDLNNLKVKISEKSALKKRHPKKKRKTQKRKKICGEDIFLMELLERIMYKRAKLLLWM